MRILPILAFLLILAPAASATRAAINLGEDLESADIELFLTIQGEDAKEVRAAIDAFGNKDGQVTNDEAEEYGDHLKPTLGQKFLDAVKASWTIDGVAPTEVEMQEFEYYHAAAPVTSDAAFEMEVVMEATYPAPRDGEAHEFHFAAGQMGRSQGFPDAVTMSVKAPAGHRIAEASPMDGIRLSEDGSLAQFTDAPDGPGAIVFTLAATAEAAKGAPTVPFPLLVIGLALSVALRTARWFD